MRFYRRSCAPPLPLALSADCTQTVICFANGQLYQRAWQSASKRAAATDLVAGEQHLCNKRACRDGFWRQGAGSHDDATQQLMYR
ncbi:hypothetical protein C9I57_23270 [Trinickia symbiotica]|uniref:Uncharacterized protein n=1 Tax=Trinickia symbiotica TaxID=863227 RepID=A0A2T3XPS4_9BURK|nr:hypothetical protein C9I57_23270 [Trinickia symbiotica]